MLDGFLEPYFTWLATKEDFWPRYIARTHDARRQEGNGFCKRDPVVMRVRQRLGFLQPLLVIRWLPIATGPAPVIGYQV